MISNSYHYRGHGNKGLGSLFEMIVSAGNDTFGSPFLEVITHKDLIQIASAVTNFAQICPFLNFDDKACVVRKLDMGKWKMDLKAFNRAFCGGMCFSVFFQEKQLDCTAPFGASPFDFAVYGQKSGSLIPKKIAQLSLSSANGKNPHRLKKANHHFKWKVFGEIIEDLFSKSSTHFGDKFLNEISKMELSKLLSAAVNFLSDCAQLTPDRVSVKELPFKKGRFRIEVEEKQTFITVFYKKSPLTFEYVYTDQTFDMSYYKFLSDKEFEKEYPPGPEEDKASPV